MSKHTPGPWEAIHPNKHLITVRARTSHAICDLFPSRTINPLSHQEFEANASLIAASPRMGEMLLRLRDHLVCGDQTERETLLRETEQVLFDAGLDEPLPEQDDGPSISYPTSGFRGMDR